MNDGTVHHRLRSRTGSAFASGLLICVLLLDYLLTLLAVGPGPAYSSAPSVSQDLPRSIRTEAERAGNLAAVHSGEGTGVQLRVRTGRTNLSPVQQLQSDSAESGQFRMSEPVPNCPFRLLSSVQTFLFQLFPRSYLPVRAGPVAA